MFVENLLSSKAAEFYKREINKLPDKWQKVIQIMTNIQLIEIHC